MDGGRKVEALRNDHRYVLFQHVTELLGSAEEHPTRAGVVVMLIQLPVGRAGQTGR